MVMMMIGFGFGERNVITNPTQKICHIILNPKQGVRV
jgi:hypothetical protein